jgi:hypothetical protein
MVSSITRLSQKRTDIVENHVRNRRKTNLTKMSNQTTKANIFASTVKTVVARSLTWSPKVGCEDDDESKHDDLGRGNGGALGLGHGRGPGQGVMRALSKQMSKQKSLDSLQDVDNEEERSSSSDDEWYKDEKKGGNDDANYGDDDDDGEEERKKRESNQEDAVHDISAHSLQDEDDKDSPPDDRLRLDIQNSQTKSSSLKHQHSDNLLVSMNSGRYSSRQMSARLTARSRSSSHDAWANEDQAKSSSNDVPNEGNLQDDVNALQTTSSGRENRAESNVSGDSSAVMHLHDVDDDHADT